MHESKVLGNFSDGVQIINGSEILKVGFILDEKNHVFFSVKLKMIGCWLASIIEVVALVCEMYGKGLEDLKRMCELGHEIARSRA